MVVVTVGFEALSSQVFVEWVAEPMLPGEAPVVLARVDAEASSGQPITWKPTLKAIAPGCVSLLLRGTPSMMPTQRAERAYWALSPGRLVAASATRRPEGCRTLPLAARKPG